eukprot:TRINITY_DN27341_c0_g1_i2.p1 TRINITY_DN27341_c0_g1~~TRINITY_DN27341_c0_g1_i2.p1  ORF type:complete len:127 (+),score=17.72 TRINITY_DN27341_c0_g1_i2:25-405(+)
MQTVTILGLVNKWDSLSHVQDWVSKNAKSYFGTAKYRKAEGCVRDELVTLGSVVLDAIRGTVMDYGSNTPPTRAVTLIHNNGVITATCDCGGRSSCLLYTSDAADEEDSVDLGGRRIIKKEKIERM